VSPPAELTATNTCGATLAAGQTCQVSVALSTGTVGDKGSQYQIISSDAVNPTLNIPIVGAVTGQPPVNPAQITWPGNCNTATTVYNFTLNTCVDLAAQTLAAGTTTTLPSGSPATVTQTGTYPNFVFNFGIPAGPPGGSLSYPGVISDGANGLIATGAVGASALKDTGLVSASQVGTDSTGKLVAGGAFSHWGTQLQKVIQRTGNARICAVGDSTTFGYLGGPGNSATNSIVGAYPTQLAQILLTQYGINASSETFFGEGMNANGAPGFSTADPRIVVGSSWTANAAMLSLGGQTYKATTSTNALSFTPAVAVDTFKVFYIVQSTGGTLSVNLDGGTATTQSTGGTAGVASMTLTGAVGTHTVNVTWASGGEVDVIGVEASNSTMPNVIIENAGAGGAKAANLASQAGPYGGGFAAIYSLVGCDLSIDEDGINDWNAAVTIPSFTTSMQTVVTAQRNAGSDVAIFSPVPSNPGTTNAAQLTYVNALQGIAAANSNGASLTLPFINNWQAFYGPTNGTTNGWAYANAQGWMADNLHPSAYGYAANATLVAGAIIPVAARVGSTQTYTPLPQATTITLKNAAVNGNWLVATNGINNTLAMHGLTGGPNDAGTIDWLFGGVIRHSISAYGGAYFNSTQGGVVIGGTTPPAANQLQIINSGASSNWLTMSNGTHTALAFHGIALNDAGQIDFRYLDTVYVAINAYTGSYFNSVSGGVAIGQTTIPAAGKLTAAAYLTNANCNINAASPGVCGAATAGRFVVPTTTTTYGINTTAVTGNSEIFVQPRLDSADFTGSPTCTAPASLAMVTQINAATNFILSIPSTAGQTCWQYWIVN
jgi:hypothetical protein